MDAEGSYDMKFRTPYLQVLLATSFLFVLLLFYPWSFLFLILFFLACFCFLFSLVFCSLNL